MHPAHGLSGSCMPGCCTSLVAGSNEQTMVNVLDLAGLICAFTIICDNFPIYHPSHLLTLIIHSVCAPKGKMK